MRESRTYGSVRAKAEWLSYSTNALFVTQNAYPREALLEAVLRFVEEDLAARGK